MGGCGKHSIDGAWLSGGGLMVCLVQSRPPESVASIQDDASRPDIVRTLRDLFSGTIPRLLELAQGNVPTVVLVPEYSLAFDDWAEIDGLIRSYPGSLIVIAGFGATRGQRLLDWKGAAPGNSSATRRFFGWDSVGEDAYVDAGSPYNGAACWMRQRNETQCVLIRKCFPEQKDEALLIPDLALGRSIVRLETDDLVIYPLICSDVICRQHDGDDPLDWVKTDLDSAPPGSRKVLISVISYQSDPFHDLWQASIARALQLTTCDCLLVLANQSIDSVHEDDRIDDRRNLSGVYGPFAMTRGVQSPLPLTRPLSCSVAGFVGAVARETGPCVLTGIVRWDIGAVQGRFIWHPKRKSDIARGGMLSASSSGDADHYELVRFLRRIQPANRGRTARHQHDWNALVEDGVAAITADLIAHRALSAARLRDSVLDGLLLGADTPASGADDLSSVREPLTRGLFALGVLATLDSVAWNQVSESPAQLAIHASDTYILVWSDPRRAGPHMHRSIQEWVNSPGQEPRLLILVGSAQGSCPEGLILPDRRTDLSQPPRESERDISQPRCHRQALCRQLANFENIYTQSPSEDVRCKEPTDAVQNRVKCALDSYLADSVWSSP